MDSHTFCLRQYRQLGVRWQSACHRYLKVVLRTAAVAEQGRVLRAYSTHTSCWLQEVELAETRQHRVVSRSWLARSYWPMEEWWNPEDRLADDPMKAQNTFQNWDEN